MEGNASLLSICFNTARQSSPAQIADAHLHIHGEFYNARRCPFNWCIVLKLRTFEISILAY